MKPEKLEIMPFGFSISFKLHTTDYNKKILKANILEIKKIIVAVSGPAINLFFILVILFSNITSIKSSEAIYANLLIILFNILPIYPLDGGRILKSVIHIFWGGKLAMIVTNKVANIIMIVITFVSSIAILEFQNIAIFFIIIYLWIIVIRENKKYKIIINAYNIA